MYWLSFIIKYDKNGKPCLCSMSLSYTTIESAMEEIEFKRNHYEVLSAWIDMFDKDNKKNTVFHECYVDCFGSVQK